MKLKDNKGVLSFIAIIITLVLVLILFSIMLNIYFKRPLSDEATNSLLKEQNIDTSSYKAIENSTRKKIDDISKESIDKLNQLQQEYE